MYISINLNIFILISICLLIDIIKNSKLVNRSNKKYYYLINFFLSLMMALNERYPNAWHMLIVRLIFVYLIRSGVQVSIWYIDYLKVKAIDTVDKKRKIVFRFKMLIFISGYE